MEKCISCNEREIYIKKRKLCSTCYHRLYNNRLIEVEDYNIIKDAEVEFMSNYFDHNDWIHEPARFKLKGTTYTPDFYDKKENVFIEVIGTRAAFSKNKAKYLLFVQTYPQINFKIMKKDGNEIPIPGKDGKFNPKLWRVQW